MKTLDERNAETSKLEVAAFKADKPRKYFLYVKLYDPETLPLGYPKEYGLVTTWTGERLGTIYHVGHKYHDNFGGQRQSIRFHGCNELSYYGTYFTSAGDYARVTAYK